jgi:hypothetical protein
MSFGNETAASTLAQFTTLAAFMMHALKSLKTRWMRRRTGRTN